jgi:hypothetical protein
VSRRSPEYFDVTAISSKKARLLFACPRRTWRERCAEVERPTDRGQRERLIPGLRRWRTATTWASNPLLIAPRLDRPTSDR